MNAGAARYDHALNSPGARAIGWQMQNAAGSRWCAWSDLVPSKMSTPDPVERGLDLLQGVKRPLILPGKA